MKIAPKILVYGPSGAGKSYGALLLPGNKFVIDSEGGTLIYRDAIPFDGPDFVMEDPQMVQAEVARVTANPGKTNLIIIDSITPIWEAAVDKQDVEGRKILGAWASKLSSFESSLNIGSWGVIARHWRPLIRDLRRSTLPVVVIARERQIFGATGTEPVCNKNLRSEFDFVLHSDSVRTKTGIVRRTYTEKVRSPPGYGLASGQSFDKPWNELIEEYYKPWFLLDGEARPRPTQEMESEFERLSSHYDPFKINARLLSLGVDRFSDLMPKDAETVLEKLRVANGST